MGLIPAARPLANILDSWAEWGSLPTRADSWATWQNSISIIAVGGAGYIQFELTSSGYELPGGNQASFTFNNHSLNAPSIPVNPQVTDLISVRFGLPYQLKVNAYCARSSFDAYPPNLMYLFVSKIHVFDANKHAIAAKMVVLTPTRIGQPIEIAAN